MKVLYYYHQRNNQFGQHELWLTLKIMQIAIHILLNVAWLYQRKVS